MICAIHQPNFLPYLGFFDKLSKSDIFIIYDDAQFCRRDFHHQNYILLNGNPFRLKVPLEYSQINTPINKIRIKKEGVIGNMGWKEYHLRNIKHAYSKSLNFNQVYPKLKELYDKEFVYLSEFNISLINLFCNLLNLSKDIKYSSDLSIKYQINSKSTEKLIDLTKSVGAKIYLSGSGGKGYIKESTFTSQKIGLRYQEFKHPNYAQIKNPFFIKNMSVIDYLFNVPRESWNI
ncbi:MAG: WbqC family protein [Candidatus Pacearchaeota archaeon]